MAYTKTNYIDKAVAYAKRFFMNWDGGNDKNLLPPFSDWTLSANTTVSAPYTLALNAPTASVLTNDFFVAVIPSTQYTFRMTYTGVAAGLTIRKSDGSVTYSSAAYTSGTAITFTTDANTSEIYVRIYNNSVSGLITFTNPQLELGSTATAFAPKKLYTITQSPGTVTQAGTPLNAANLNKMEQGIYDAHVTADGALQRSGGTMTGSPVLNNNVGIYSKTTGGVLKNLGVIGGDNQIYYSDSSMPTYINSNGTLLHNGFQMWDQSKLRVHSSGTYVEWYNGSAWQGLGGIKSVQRGISGSSNVTITITAVNMSKSFVTFNNVGHLNSDGGAPYRASLTSSTTLVIAPAASFTGNANFAWEVVEFY